MALEIERKFLVLNDSYKKESFSHSHIRQGYICSERGRTVRVRIRDDHAYLTIKGPSLDGGLSRYEFEKEISVAEGEQLMRLCEPGIIDKTRYILPAEALPQNNTPTELALKWEIDEFRTPNAGLVMAEIELPSEDTPFVRPPFIGEEVTHDSRYYNANMV